MFVVHPLWDLKRPLAIGCLVQALILLTCWVLNRTLKITVTVQILTGD
jgi:hypothetical protein